MVHPFCFSKELREGWEDAILRFQRTFDHAYDTGVVFETPKVIVDSSVIIVKCLIYVGAYNLYTLGPSFLQDREDPLHNQY